MQNCELLLLFKYPFLIAPKYFAFLDSYISSCHISCKIVANVYKKCLHVRNSFKI